MIPVRRSNSWDCHSTAATSPRSSSTLGRSSVAIRRTVSMVPSIRTAELRLALREAPDAGGVVYLAL